MTSPNSDAARSTLLQYHGFVLGLWEFNHLKSAGDEKRCKSIAQRLENTFVRLKRDFHGINGVKTFYKGYEFNFEWAEGLLGSIVNNETYSNLEMKGLADSLPIREFLFFDSRRNDSTHQYSFA